MPSTVTLEHYEVLTRPDGSLHELGRGAMGITYKGRDTRLDVVVALKVINAAHLNSESARQRFVREARAAAQLRHRHVASVFHLGEEGGNYFYAMEYIAGETAEALVKREGPLAPALALRLTAQVARALNAAQTHHLVHRDIKPANLMVVREDDDLVVKVIDFGLAKTAFGGAEGDGSLTHGGFLGTPHFASPEQLEEREIDVRSDIYSLGVTLWWLLRGATPFTGSVARVIGQHLSKPPPFEQLDALPSGVVELLRRMLEKDAADRPQTPAALRKEIEQCLAAIDPAARAVSASTASGVLPGSSRRGSSANDDARWQTGETIGERYVISAELGESEAGRNFRARDLTRERDVRLLVLHRELLEETNTVAQLEREAAALAAAPHPHLLEVFGIESAGSAVFLVLGWTEGFNLRELLRVRRELTATEVAMLLGHLAKGAEAALAAPVERCEVTLHDGLIHFAAPGVSVDDLLDEPVESWPVFVAKVSPLAAWHTLFGGMQSAGQTLVVTPSRDGHAAPSGTPAAIQALARIAYELLGGVAMPGALRFRPLAELDESGNAVLQRALFAPESFASPEEFVRQFTRPPKNEPAYVSQRPPATVAPAVERTPTAAAAIEEISLPPVEPPSSFDAVPPRPSRRPPWGALAAGVALLAAGTGGYIWWRAHRALLTPAAPPQLVRLETPTPVPTFPPPTIPPRSHTPSPPTPRPSPPPPPPPTPPPTRQELAIAARRTAEKFEAQKAHRAALSAWLGMTRNFPEFDTGRLGMEMLLNRLRRQPGGLSNAEFSGMQKEIREAANRGVLAAMMTLGDELRASEPKQSFAWFCAAAQGGDPLGMTHAGNMLAAGSGTPADITKAIAYYHAAAELKEPNAIAALGECYLTGKGVAKDEGQAITLLQDASDKGHIPARNKLGVCYHKGLGVTRDDREAFRLFSEAAARGNAEAIGNLGLLYVTGEGVEKNEAKAVEKFKAASLKGDVPSMFYYAGCLQNGLGVKANPAAAKTWFQKAAEAGDPQAIEWCKTEGIPFKAAR